MIRWVLRVLSALLGTLLAALLWLTQPGITPKIMAVPSPSVERLKQHVRALSETYHPRSFDRPEKLEAAAGYIVQALTEAGATPEAQVFEVAGQPFKNLVTRFGPKDSGAAWLVIGAHYDSVGATEGEAPGTGATPNDSYTPGADDNASGVAGLIELARLLVQQPPKVPVELVAYSLEEPPNFRTPNMGSAHHAARLKAEGRAVELMLSLEMIGFFDDHEGRQEYPAPGMTALYPSTGNFIAVVGRPQDALWCRKLKAAMQGAAPLPVYSLNAPAGIPGIDFSDHLNYWAEHFPALMVTDTSFFRNREYHRQGDTWDTLDYVRMSQVVQGVFAFVLGQGAAHEPREQLP